jgi:inorganic pyrophosphatase
MPKSSYPLSELAPRAEGSSELRVVVETPKGARNKYKYNEEKGFFELRKILPAGAVFPFDFGFVPSTRGEDGDPLDILILLEEPVFTGCVVGARLLGVIEAEQTSKEEGTQRNDRLIAVPSCSGEHDAYKSIEDVGEVLLRQIEHFFVSYNVIEGNQFSVLGRRGPERAEELIERGIAAFKR